MEKYCINPYKNNRTFNSKTKHSLYSNMEKRKRREKLKSIVSKSLPKDFFQNIVELENIIIKSPTKDNYFELLNLYKVILFNN